MSILQYSDEIMREDFYQKRTWKDNQNRIIQLLSEKSLTFKEVITESGLSRAVANEHLKSLEARGLIKKEYVSGKLLNVLQVSKLDLVEWFLDRLASVGVPKEVVEKGKTVLSKEVLAYSAVIYFLTSENMRKIIGQTTEGKLLESVVPLFPSKMEIPDFKTTVTSDGHPLPKQLQEYFRLLLSELNPYSFNVVMTVYSSERTLHEAVPRLLKKDPDKFFIQTMETMSDNLKKGFDKTSEWWFEGVVNYLPSSGFFIFLTVIYMDILLGTLGHKRSLQSLHLTFKEK